MGEGCGASLCGEGAHGATRARLFVTARNAMAARTSSGSEISDGTPTVALATTKTIRAKTVNKTTTVTTHGLRVRTPEDCTCYSLRNARVGSSPAARRAGM